MIEEKNSLKIKLIEFLKNPKEVVIFFMPVFITLILLIPLNYHVYLGGGVIPLESKIELEKENSFGKYGALYVRESKANVLTYLLSLIVPSFDNEKITVIEKDNKESINYIEKVHFTSSIDNATKIAFEKANKNITVKESKLYVSYIDKLSKTNLKLKDQIIKVNNKSISTYDEFLKSLNVDSDSISITVLRDGKEVLTTNYFININGSKKLGIIVANEIKYETDPKVSFNFKGSEAGSSGGLMMALVIYDKLISEDLTKSKNIMGTGSIDEEGNVLEVGGIKYKLQAAKNKKADIVFVPYNNYEEAKKIYDDKKYSFDLVPVKTFDDAVNYLKNN